MIFLGIGSNLSSDYGDRFKNIDLSIKYLLEEEIKLIRKSSFYESLSFPNKKFPKYINIVVSIDTTLTPEKLAEIILKIEKRLGGKRSKKNDPRICDIDILDYKGKNISFEFNNFKFLVPHKDMASRNFVLYPLKEICSNWKHPITNDLINDLIKKLSNADKNSILKINKS